MMLVNREPMRSVLAHGCGIGTPEGEDESVFQPSFVSAWRTAHWQRSGDEAGDIAGSCIKRYLEV